VRQNEAAGLDEEDKAHPLEGTKTWVRVPPQIKASIVCCSVHLVNTHCNLVFMTRMCK
jgi:hypothetical protein